MAPYKSDSDWLKIAVETAEKGIRKGWGGPFGAAIVVKNKLIATACNTVIKNQDATCHAEINALRDACRKFKNFAIPQAIVYSTTEPCPMCFSALHWARVKKIVYATTIQDVQKLGFNELSVPNKIMKSVGKSPLIIKKIIHEPSRILLAEWAALPHKRTY